MSKLFIGKKCYAVPGNWEQLEASQTLALIPLLQARKPDDEMKVRALLILLNAKKNLKLQWILRQINAEQLADMLLLTDFLWEKRAFTAQKFRKVGNYLGPADSFTSLVFVEFIKAEQYYLSFSKTQEVPMLDRMIAVLWREADPAKTTGDQRERYNDDTLEARVQVVSKWTLAQKLAIYLWFDSCRQQLVLDFPLVFQPQGGGTFSPTKRPKGWIDVATSLAENVTNVEEVLYTDLYMVMLYLSNKVEEAQEQKHKMEKSK